MIYDFKTIDFKDVPSCLDKVIGLLAESCTLMTALVNMPIAEPEDPRWNEFEKRPHIHELVEVLCAIYDAEELTKKTCQEIAGEKVNA